MNSSLFMPNQKMTDFILLEYFVINWQDSTTWITEYRVHTMVLEGLNNHLCPCHPGVFRLVIFKLIHGLIYLSDFIRIVDNLVEEILTCKTKWSRELRRLIKVASAVFQMT